MRPSVAQVAALPVLPVEGEDESGAHGHVPTVPTIAAVARPTGTKQIAENRRARHDYQLLDRFEAGIVLTGTEVKSLREGRVEFGGAYADVRGEEVFLVGATIAEYDHGNMQNHDPDRDRKLLLHRREIASLIGKVREKGLTLVPTRLYFKDGKVKVELALARGKERIDKRRDLQKRDAERQIERALKSRR
jgi:SsrA-binding protein